MIYSSLDACIKAMELTVGFEPFEQDNGISPLVLALRQANLILEWYPYPDKAARFRFIRYRMLARYND